MPAFSREDLQNWIERACVLEATARKPGNVHPRAAFPDLDYADFTAAAQAVAPILARTAETGVGQAVLLAIEATRLQARRPTNANLGIVLLLAPLAAVPAGCSLCMGIGPVLGQLTQLDAAYVYEAIRSAAPGGLGKAATEDVSQQPTVTLLEAMQLAADRDAIAAQYANNFETVLRFGVPYLTEAVIDFETDWEEAIIGLHLKLMSHYPDTLIGRKCGAETATLAAQKARAVFDAGWPASESGQLQIAELDIWLRADGHRRNPGATADLVAACLFAAFRERILPPVKLLSNVE